MTIVTIIIIAISTILAWQLVQSIAAVLTNENEKVSKILGYGFWCLIGSALFVVKQKIRLHNSRKYNCYMVYGLVSNNEDTMDGYIKTIYMKEKVASKYFVCQTNKDEKVKENYSIKLLRTGKEFKSIPFKSDIVTEKMILEGNYGLGNYNKFFRNN